MKPTIVANGVTLSQVLRDHVVRRLRFALSRTKHSIRAVVVRLSDQNGPKGGVDKRCRIHLSLPGLPPVVVSSTAAEIVEAVDRAAHRAALAVDRLRDRARDTRRTRHAVPALA